MKVLRRLAMKTVVTVTESEIMAVIKSRDNKFERLMCQLTSMEMAITAHLNSDEKKNKSCKIIRVDLTKNGSKQRPFR